MLKVSVIVPIYNVERYLPICLDSIRAQSYRNIEILCVNDGSQDRSREILDLYKKADPRVVVIDQQNAGLSAARNAGILNATGDVICFVDSDDLIKRNTIERIVEVFESEHPDVLTFGGEGYPAHRSNPWIDESLSPRAITYDGFTPELLEENARPYVGRTALSREFLLASGVLFDERLRFGEDQLFHFAIYPRSARTVLIPDKLYQYRIGREGSLMDSRSSNRFLRLYDHVRIVEHIARDWSKGGFIEPYGKDLLLISSDFVLCDLLGMGPYERYFLANYLQYVWTYFFPQDQLDALLRDREFGSMASAILVDRRKAFSFRRKLMFYHRTLLTHPLEFFRKLWIRISFRGPVGWVRRVLRRGLPMSSHVQQRMLLDAEWEARESHKLVDSLSLIRLEVEGKAAAEGNAAEAGAR